MAVAMSSHGLVSHSDIGMPVARANSTSWKLKLAVS